MKLSKPLRSELEERPEPGEAANDAYEGLGACWLSNQAGRSRRPRRDAFHRTTNATLKFCAKRYLRENRPKN